MNRSLRIAAKLLFAGALTIGALTSKAQLKVGDNPTNIQRSAVLELESNRQGLLLPRLTDTAAINALAPLDGMIIYFSDGVTPGPNRGLYVRKFGHWVKMADASVAGSNWTLTGNTGTNPTNNYIGTSDAQALSIRTNATEAVRVTATGNVELKNVAAGTAEVEVLVLGTGGAVMRRTMPAAAFSNVISSLNGDLTPDQTLEVDSAGMDFNIVHNGTGEHRFNIPTQDGTKTRGLLTQADWNRINDAQKAIVIGTFSITPVATGLSLDAATGTLTLHAADATNPGAVSTAAQTFAGAKTFQDDLTAAANLNVTGNAVVGGDATVTGVTTLNGAATLNGATTLAGATTLDNTLTATNAFPAAAAAENDVLIRAASGVISQKTLNAAAFDGAVQSINGQTGPAVHFKNGTDGNDVAFDSTTTANVITLNVPDAAVTARGVVTTGAQAFAGAKNYRDSVAVGVTTRPNSTLQVEGSLALAITTVNTNYTVTATDNTVLVDAATAPVTITLPAAGTIKGRIYTIKKIAGGLDNGVTITPAGGAQIEGGTSYPIYNDWTFVTLQTDGTNWYIIKK
ncbi:hypothetical protein [uncultured Chitinophaga sp.]|jgi:hypothetical protein|uniref:hypothetical protein n=1 Tax=uncultured Chitinophaga sp. TaxID=339340 RepID=UPI0026156B0C|nr:hypothetical protein [uncultured Chitinophaga sp.]